MDHTYGQLPINNSIPYHTKVKSFEELHIGNDKKAVELCKHIGLCIGLSTVICILYYVFILIILFKIDGDTYIDTYIDYNDGSR